MSAVQSIANATTTALPANDDGSSPAAALGFAFNFFGTVYTQTFVNNNGTLTFAGSQITYTPYALTDPLNNPILAGLLCDVDTRNADSALVTYGTGLLGEKKVFFANFVGVGYYDRRADKKNSFQILLVDRSDIADGDADVIYNFDAVQFETGEASGGVNGLGGTSAAMGYSSGTGFAGEFVEAPGSRKPGSFLDNSFETGLVHNSGSPDGVKGRYVFPVRSGQPSAPALPPASPGPVNLVPTTFPTGDLHGSVLPALSTVQVVSGRKAESQPAYTIDHLPIGLYSVLLTQCGYTPQLHLATITPNAVTVLDGTLAAHDAEDGFGYIAGWAVDQVSGKPLANAEVTAGGYDTGTDTGGGFLLRLPVGVYSLTVSVPGYPSFTWGAPVTVEADCPAVLGPVGLPGGGADGNSGSVTGYIEDALTYAPLADAIVGLIEAPVYSADTDAAGAYLLEFVPTPIVLTVIGVKEGYRMRRSQVALASGQTARLDMGLVPLTTPVGSIDGFVTDAATGLAVSGASVRVAGVVQSVTNALGYYVLPDVPVGNVAVQCIAEGYAPQQSTVSVVDGVMTRKSFALAAFTGGSAVLFGQVRDAVTGVGLGSVLVATLEATAYSGPRGAYLISFPVPPKTQNLAAHKAGYYPLELDNLPVAASQSVELDLGLVSTSTPVGALHGLVVDARHSSVRLGGARVSLGRFLQTLATFPQGEYLLPYVPSGVVYQGTATEDGYAPGVVNGVEVRAGEVLELDFPLVSLSDEAAPTFALTVTVLEAGSLRPLAGAVVSAGAFGVADAVTSSAGVAVLGGVPAGAYTLSASLAGYRAGTAQTVVAADQAAQIILRGFPDGYTGGEVFGYVSSALLPPGQSVAGCLVSASPAFAGGWTGPNVVTDSGGFYVLDNVPVGELALTFDDPDYVPLTLTGIESVDRTATRADAVLSPWDGRLPDGWGIAFGAAQALSRPPAATVVTLRATEADVAARRMDTLALVAQADTAALGRYRRLRYGNRAETESGETVLKVAVALAPGVVLPSMPEAMAIPAPLAKVNK